MDHSEHKKFPVTGADVHEALDRRFAGDLRNRATMPRLWRAARVALRVSVAAMPICPKHTFAQPQFESADEFLNQVMVHLCGA
jgi:hypothetical protein